MLKFFRSLKRRVGLGLLLITCLIAGMWFRSLDNHDRETYLYFDMFGRSQSIVSISGQLAIVSVVECQSDEDRSFAESKYHEEREQMWFNHFVSCVIWNQGSGVATHTGRALIFPYWFVISILIGVCGCCFLTKDSGKLERKGEAVH